MENVKRYLMMMVATVMVMAASAQQSDYKKQIEAFQTSYLKEASGDIAAAIDVLKAVYSEDIYEINLRLGWLCYLSGGFTESTGYYNRAVALKPFAIEPKFGLTYPMAALGNWDAVIRQYREVLKIAPNNTIAMHKLALIHYGRKEYEEAEVLFTKVVDLFPFDYDGLLMLGWTKYQLKKYREAQVLFSKALMNTPGGSSALEGIQLLDQ